MENFEEFVKERIRENEELFTEKELDYINENKDIVKKIYLLGFINARDSYKS